jgi:hypothetical protein
MKKEDLEMQLLELQVENAKKDFEYTQKCIQESELTHKKLKIERLAGYASLLTYAAGSAALIAILLKLI